jgi:hypothetical protein
MKRPEQRSGLFVFVDFFFIFIVVAQHAAPSRKVSPICENTPHARARLP